MTTIGIECESIEEQSWGVGRIVRKLLEEVSRRPELRKEFTFFLYFKSKVPDLPFLNDPIFVKNVVWQPFTRKSFVLYYYLFLPLKLWFRRHNVMFFPNYMLPLIFFGTSLVMLTQDIYYEMRSPAQRFRHRLAYRIFGTWAAMAATRIMAISESSARELTRLFGIPQRRIAVNQLAVDVPRRLDAVSDEGLDFTRELLKKTPYLLFVGQMFPRRRIKESLEAFKGIAPDFPGLKFIIIGQDHYRPPILDSMVTDMNRELGYEAVLLRSYVPDDQLALLYAHARACVYVSSREAFGLPPLEALSYKTPAVIADNQTSREIFGTNAFLVEEPTEPSSIAKAMRRALTDQKAGENIVAAAEAVTKRFSWGAHTDRFLDIVRSLASH